MLRTTSCENITPRPNAVFWHSRQQFSRTPVQQMPCNLRLVRKNGFFNLRADAHHRIQRSHRLLKNHRNLAPPHMPPLLLAQSNKIPPRSCILRRSLGTLCRGGACSSLFAPAQQNFSANPRPRGQQSHQRQRQHRLPAPRFPHQPDALAGANQQRHPIHRPHPSRRRRHSRSNPQHREEKGVTWRKWLLSLLRDESSRNINLISSMATAVPHRVDWSLLWQQRGFRYFFTAMFVSLFGSGMNFIGVSWYIMSATHSTVAVSWQVIVVTLPGLVVPFLGGVLIDRIDRRYLGVLLDLARGFAVLAIAFIAWRGHLHIWHLYLITLITGTGSAMYWSNVNALVQEGVPPSQFTGANASVLVGVQSGMLLAGTFVGFFYDNMGIAGILLIDGLTYFVSAYCLYRMRSGYVSPRDHRQYPREYSESTDTASQALVSGENPEIAEAGASLAIYAADMKEGFAYLRSQPVVLALGVTHAILMASVVSGNVVVVALANDVLHSGSRGFGFIEAGWAIGAIAGGLITSQLPQKVRLPLYVAVMAGPAVGHVAVPFVTFLLGAAVLPGFFGFFRAPRGLVAQSSLMSIVPRPFMGRTQSPFAIIATILQLAISFSLGWLAQRFSIATGFFLLALMYAGATLSASRARALLARRDFSPTGHPEAIRQG